MMYEFFVILILVAIGSLIGYTNLLLILLSIMLLIALLILLLWKGKLIITIAMLIGLIFFLIEIYKECF